MLSSFGLFALGMLVMFLVFGAALCVMQAESIRVQAKADEVPPGAGYMVGSYHPLQAGALCDHVLVTTVEPQRDQKGFVATGPLQGGSLAVGWGSTREAALSELYAHQLADLRPEGDDKHAAPPLEIFERNGADLHEVKEVDQPITPPQATFDATFRQGVIPLRRDATFRAPAQA